MMADVPGRVHTQNAPARRHRSYARLNDREAALKDINRKYVVRIPEGDSLSILHSSMADMTGLLSGQSNAVMRTDRKLKLILR